MSRTNPKFAELKNQIIELLKKKGPMTSEQIADFVPQNWSVTQIGTACRVLTKSDKVHASAYVNHMILWKEGAAPHGEVLRRNYRHLNHRQIIELLAQRGPMTASQISQWAHLPVSSTALTCSHLQARGEICGQQVPVGNSSVRMITVYGLPGQTLPNQCLSAPGMVSMKDTLSEHQEWMRKLLIERHYKAQRHAMRGRA